MTFYFEKIWKHFNRELDKIKLPTTPLIFLDALWIGFSGFFAYFRLSDVVICHQCKRIINAKPAAKKIINGFCWRCFYQDNGGRWFLLSQIRELAIFKAMRKIPKDRDEFWDTRTIHDGLFKNGIIIEKAKRRTGPEASLFKDERAILDCTRDVARKMFGYNNQDINRTEFEGQLAYCRGEIQ